MKIAIIQSEFNQAITDALCEGAQAYLLGQGVLPDDLTIYRVPGAVEIPLVAKRLAKKGEVDAVIALGCVIRGETSHYDYVCSQVSDGCAQLMLQYELPIIFGVLTTESQAQALDRVGGEKGHKGVDAAKAALSMIELLKTL